MVKSANNVSIGIGARVAALNNHDQDWCFPGIVTNNTGNTFTVLLDAGSTITEVLPQHIWIIDLARDYPKLYWGYPSDFTKYLSTYPVPSYFNRSVVLRSFGYQLVRGMIYCALHLVFNEYQMEFPKIKIIAMLTAGKAYRNNTLAVQAQSVSLKHLWDSVCHELVHLWQYKYVPPREQLLETSSGMHGVSFMRWKEPLEKVGVELGQYDTKDADLEIPQAGGRDKPFIVILLKDINKDYWTAAITTEAAGREAAMRLSRPGNIVCLVRIVSAVLVRHLVKMNKALRTVKINDNVLNFIITNGQPLSGFSLPPMSPKASASLFEG